MTPSLGRGRIAPPPQDGRIPLGNSSSHFDPSFWGGRGLHRHDEATGRCWPRMRSSTADFNSLLFELSCTLDFSARHLWHYFFHLWSLVQILRRDPTPGLHRTSIPRKGLGCATTTFYIKATLSKFWKLIQYLWQNLSWFNILLFAVFINHFCDLRINLKFSIHEFVPTFTSGLHAVSTTFT